MKQPGDAVNISRFNFVEFPRPITLAAEGTTFLIVQGMEAVARFTLWKPLEMHVTRDSYPGRCSY